jgi:release factor glutamine methyltransferase
MALYEPQEDSELLRRFVEQEARGDVLDMGAGSGILALAAVRKREVTSVLAVDSDEESLTHLKKEIAKEDDAVKKKITAVKSDLFRNLGADRFDTIVCNPPYLPDENDDSHPALYGGPGGWEFIARFLSEAKNHLNKGGIILLLFSSLSNKERILQLMKSEGYHSIELSVAYHFFEQLYVYKLWRDGDE